MGKKLDVVTIGELNVEQVLSGVPKIDEWVEVEKGLKGWVGEAFTVFFGDGMAGYSSQVMSKLGLKCGLIGKIGNDRYGKLCFENLEEAGIDLQYIQIEKGTPTGVTYYIFSNNGEKRWAIPRTWLDSIDVMIDERYFGYIKSARHLFISGYLLLRKMLGNPTETLLKYAKKNALTISLDPQASFTGDWTIPANILSLLDILLVNKHEATKITGCSSVEESTERFKDLGCRGIIAIKMGDKGCYVRKDDLSLKVPAFKIPTIVDDIGAGDAFNAGFVYGYLKNWGLKKTAEFANAVAALSLREAGGVTGVPSSIDEIEKFCKNAKRNY